ncbi:methylenetetrahydrofolate reductase [Saccharobesus litoralis]|uniref:Methylenetetrahydrofolate reductase n=1 Tax=Saccharobesus litoralis TaxID=2172099 RepID=A0A2S0VWC3_9ALTE|nr:methylenetetrahydrofolate reductase [Saccharobesus litoralis]AWB68519.1 methylenetetrahydrofolate reductase [Saccharobesus litoralis]
MKVSFEVVPRTEDATREQLEFVQQHLPQVNTINVPDLLRLPIRSWEGANFIDRNQYDFIPHVRAIDFNRPEKRLQKLIHAYQLDKVLIVSGDPPPDMSHRVYDTKVLDLIADIRADFPDIKIYCGFDPYRSSVKQEKEYIQQKFDVGCDYILSQPFFDMRLLEVYSDFLPPEKTFWGISPVVTEKSQAYWERMNHVVFPSSFDASYEWNIDFTQQVIEHSAKVGSHIYFMPIRIDLERYFKPVAAALAKI